MRYGIRVLALATLLAVAFAAGAYTAGTRHWFQPVVHVSIKNDSGRDLSVLKLTYSSGGVQSNMTLPVLKNGQSTDVHFYVAGEGGYAIEAGFADGSILKGGAGYVESGYSIAEVIGTSKIESRTAFYAY